MKKRQILICIPLFAIAACNFGDASRQIKPDVFKDTLSYSYQTVNKRSPETGKVADSNYAEIKLKYPVFKGHPALNDTVTHRLLTLFAFDGKAETGLQAMVTTFFKDHAAFLKDGRKGIPFKQDMYTNVITQDSALLAMEYGGYSYRGGAHGTSFTGFINWNPITDKKITLNDLLVNDYKDQLNKIAERIFRKDEKLKDTSSLARDYFFKDNKFALNDNYLLTPLGLRFVYNQYEIKPYAAGQTELLIPYADIKKLVRPKAVIAQYIK